LGQRLLFFKRYEPRCPFLLDCLELFLILSSHQVYETLTYLLSPFILPISLLVRPAFCIAMLAAITGLYILQVILFNEIHLRRKNQRTSWKVVIGYYVSQPRFRSLDWIPFNPCPILTPRLTVLYYTDPIQTRPPPYQRRGLFLVHVSVCAVLCAAATEAYGGP
jgi:hypothetical protein